MRILRHPIAGAHARSHANGIPGRGATREKGARALLALFLAAILPAAALRADTITVWTGNTNTDYGTAGNWNNGIPNGAFSATIPGGTSNEPVIAVNQTYTVDNLTLSSAGATLNFDNNGHLVVNAAGGGVISNAGTIGLNATGSNTSLELSGTNGTVYLNGAGVLQMGNAAGNQIIANSTGMTFENNSTIQGSGSLIGTYPHYNAYTFINNGTVTATGSVGLTINPSGGVTNNGLLQASGGTLTLAGDTFTNTNGTIQANTASTVMLSGSTIAGGILQTSGTGVIQSVSGNTPTLAGVITLTQGSNFNIGNSSKVDLASGLNLTNNGTLTLASTGSASQLVLTGTGGTVTLAGTGTYSMGNSATNQIISTGSGMTLINNSTIQGAGSLNTSNGSDGNNYTLTNNGTITATGSVGLTINPGGGVTNNGLLQASGGTLTLQADTFTNTNGTILANNGNAVTLNGSTISGGMLQTSGTGVIQSIAGGNGSTPTLSGAVTLTTGSDFDVGNGAKVDLANGLTLTNNGTLTLASTGSASQLILVGSAGTVTLGGSGTYTMGNAPTNQIIALGTGETLVNNSTIQGGGALQTSNGSDGLNYAITNNGTISATGNLTIRPGNGVTNTGTLTANGGILTLTGTFNQTGNGGITAQNGGTVVLSAATVIGGAIGATGGSFINTVGNNYTTLSGPVTITPGSVLAIGNNSGLYLQAGTTLTNNGAINLQSTGSQSNVVLTGGGTVAINGTGKLFASDGSSLEQIYSATGGMTLVNGGSSSISGSVQFTNSSQNYAIINNGTLSNSNTTSMNIKNGAAFTNNGTIMAAAGSSVNIGSNVDFTNLSGGTLTGGTYDASGTISMYGSIADNAANIQLTGAEAELLDSQNGNNALKNFVYNEAAGSFDLEGEGNFVATGSFTNAGMLGVGSSSIFETADQYDQNSGITEVNGTLNASGGVTIDGGTLDGTGTIDGDILVGSSGIVSPGDAPGALTINGNYTMSPTGAFDVGFATSAIFDSLDISGTAGLAGTLNLQTLADFTPFTGETFDIMKFGSSSGTFRSITGTNLGGGYTFSVQYNPTDVAVTVDGPATPEPASVLLLGLGLLGLLASRKFKNLKKVSSR